LLDVLVTDEDGNVVVGLDAEDFLVEEEGQPMGLESAAFYSNRDLFGALSGEGTAGEGDAVADRYFALVFYRPPVAAGRDHRLYLQLPELGKSAFQWIVEELQPNDHVAVLAYDSSLRLYQDFSQDRSRLGQALHRAATGRTPDARWPSRAETAQEGIRLRALWERPELPTASADPFEALALLAEELGTVRGRKMVLLFGFDLPAIGSAENRRGYQPMVEAFNTHNAAVYTVGVTRLGFQPSLEQIAADTGGEYLYHFSSFLSPLRHIARQNSGYYLLSYRSPLARTEAGYREVRVQVRQPGLEVRHRRGYRLEDAP
jgi:VWFA-related protein